MNVQKVKGKMKEKEITGEQMAEMLGVNPSTFYRKLKKGGNDFSVADLYVFKRELDLEDKQALEFLLS